MLYTEEAILKRKQKVETAKKAISIIAYILIISLLIYNISLIAQAIKNPNKTPSFLGVKTYTIVSGSMEPTIQIGDIVIVKEVAEDELKEGDVISFRQGQSVITHRIVEIKENEKTYITKGDSNNVEDSIQVDFNSVEGKQIWRIPFLGRISQLLQGKITIIVIALMTYIFFSHASKITRIKKRRRIKRIKHEEEKSKESEA